MLQFKFIQHYDTLQLIAITNSVWFRPSDAKGARAIDKLPMSNLKQLYRAIESRTFIDS